jgi:small subunit ribosomal protein S1
MDSIQTATSEVETGDALVEEALTEDVVDSESPTNDSLAGEMAVEEVVAEEEAAEDVLVEETVSEEALDIESGAQDEPTEDAFTGEAAAEELGEAAHEEPGEAAAEEPGEAAAKEPGEAAAEELGEADAEELGEDAPSGQEAVQDSGGTGEMGDLPVEDWDYQQPKRGQIRPGVILSIGEQEIIVDVDAKRDGLVPFADMQRMGDEALAELSAGDEVMVYILRPEDQDGNLLVSLFQARQAQAWQRVGSFLESGEVIETEIIGYNKGGLVAPVQDIRGFIPASQVPGFPQGLRQEERLERLSGLVGEKVQVKVIEFNRRNRRLILSATAAQRQWRKRERERLLDELREGEVRHGVVSSLCSFGAFVDLGGADGLVHLSELSWRRVRHPREVLRVGQEVDAYVLRLDKERKRIGLSLKRLQAEPWALVEDKYELGQLVECVVTNVVDFGAFAEIEEGVEGLIHVSELSDQPISHPKEVVKKGDLLLLRIIRIDIRRKRLGLSLKRVLESELAEWAARLALDEAEAAKAAEPEPSEAGEMEAPAAEVPEVGDEVDEPPVLEEAADDRELATAPSSEEPSEVQELPEPPEAETPPEVEDAEDAEAAAMLSEELAEAEEIPEPPDEDVEEDLESVMPEAPGEDEAPPQEPQAQDEEELAEPTLEEAEGQVLAETKAESEGSAEEQEIAVTAEAEGEEVQDVGESEEAAASSEIEEERVLAASEAESEGPAEEPDTAMMAEAEGEDVQDADETEEAPALSETGEEEAPPAMMAEEPGEDQEAEGELEAEEPEESAEMELDESGEAQEPSEPSGDETEGASSPATDEAVGDEQEPPESPDAELEDMEDAEQASE